MVFSELQTKRTLLQLQLTCKAWRQVAEEFLYKEITFNLGSTGEKDEHLVATLELPNTQYKFFVKTLQLQRPFHIEPVKNYTVLLMKVLIACPNLVCVSNGDMALPWSDFYQTITTLRRAGYLQKAGDIGGYLPYKNTLENYNNAVIEFASSLQKLTLPEPDDDIATLASDLKAIDAYALGSQLKLFRCLKELSVDLIVDSDLRRMDSLLDEAPNSLAYLSVNVNDAETRYDRMEKFDPPRDGRRFAQLDTLRLSGMSAFTDQDMLYLMHKFPNVKHLNVDLYYTIVPNLQVEKLQSANVVCKFMTYLMQQKPFCKMEHLITTSQIMHEIITQLSEHSAVKKMRVFSFPATITTHPDICFMGTLDPKDGYEIWLEVNMPSFDIIDVLYQHTMGAFFQSLEHLIFAGESDVQEEEDQDWEDFSGTQHTHNMFKDHIGYILSNYLALKTLTLDNMILTPLSSTKPISTRELEKLEIVSCCLQPEVLTQLSQRLEYVETMCILQVTLIRDEAALLASDTGYTINMPFTGFDTIHLDTSLSTSTHHLFRIWTSTTVVRFVYDTHSKVHEFLTKKEFQQHSRTMVDSWHVMVFCASCNAISINDCEILIPENKGWNGDNKLNAVIYEVPVITDIY